MKKLVFILSILAFVGCTERIDIEVDKSYTRIVVDGTISNDTMAHLVRITKTADFFDGTPAPDVSGATVFIIEKNDTVFLTENEEGHYYTPRDFYAKTKTNYELVVENVDINEDGVLEEYRAVDEMTYALPIDSINLLKTYIEGPNREFIGIMLFTFEPPEKNYYIFKSRINGELLPETVTEWGLSDDEFINGNYTNGFVVKYLDQTDSTEILRPGETYTLELTQISESYFDFLNAVNLESFGNIPLFSGPPANIKGNISNDGIGYFAAIAISRANARYKLPDK